MTWRENLRRVIHPGGRKLIGGSFRGVSFFVDNAERGGGRRAVVHEFPLRDDPFVEDLGRRARTFRVEAYVVGDDYLTQRNKLLAALEDESGPGELVHPYHGAVRAICINVSVSESRNEGGFARFAIEFQEAPAQAAAPVDVIDSASQVSTSADAALASSKGELVEKYSVSGMPAFALESAERVIAGIADGMAFVLGPVAGTAQALAEFSGRMEILTAQAASLARQPGDAFDAVLAAVAGVAASAANAPGDVMDALIDAYASDTGPAIAPTTSTRERELANQTALAGALKQLLVIEAARQAPLVEYTSIDEALAARDSIAALLDEQAQTAGDTAFPALVSLRSEVLRAVPGGRAFARVTTVTRNVPLPSLLIAYQLYGSVDLEPDIIARNGIRHPGFVAGDLKVLSDE